MMDSRRLRARGYVVWEKLAAMGFITTANPARHGRGSVIASIDEVLAAEHLQRVVKWLAVVRRKGQGAAAVREAFGDITAGAARAWGRILRYGA